MTKTFEQNMDELNAVVSRLSEGGVGLSESIALYEKGKKLAAQCEKQLNEAKTRITTVETGEEQ